MHDSGVKRHNAEGWTVAGLLGGGKVLGDLSRGKFSKIHSKLLQRRKQQQTVVTYIY